MIDRKQKKLDASELLSLDKPDQYTLIAPEPITIASGYSISIKYDEDGHPVIYVKKYGDIDTRGLRREIERTYPGACIQGLASSRLVKIDENQNKKQEREESESTRRISRTKKE